MAEVYYSIYELSFGRGSSANFNASIDGGTVDVLVN
jgi:hypothetical protein